MVWGDIDRADAERARRIAAPILGRELALPVRVDALRLIERLRAVYGPRRLAGAFERVYCGAVPISRDALDMLGGEASAVAARLQEEVERERYAELFLRTLHRMSEKAGDDTEALATLADPDAMGPILRECVRVTTWTAIQLQQRIGAAVVASLADPNQARRVVSRLLADHPVVLTEDAWDAMLTEQDPEVFRFWTGLLAIPGFELRTTHVRRAMFENVALRRYAMALARDETEMRDVAARVEEARARRGA